MVRMLLTVTLLLLAPPAWAGSLNEHFTFPAPVYLWDPRAGILTGHGEGGQFDGLGDVSFTLAFQPDPEGGHPLAWRLRFEGIVPELGLPDWTELATGLLLEGPFRDGPRHLSFGVFIEESQPALGLGHEVWETWDVFLTRRVAVPPTGVLVGLAVILAVMLSVARSRS